MKISWLYIILYRGSDGQILQYATDTPELYRAELRQLRREGREIVRHWRQQL